MPVDISRTTNGAVVIARFCGRLSETDIRQAVTLAFTTQRGEPCMDRLILVEPAASIPEIDTVALQRIQRCLHRVEASRRAYGPFRSIFVYSSPLHAPLLQLYKAILDQFDFRGIEFVAVSSLAESARLLGVPLSELAERPE